MINRYINEIIRLIACIRNILFYFVIVCFIIALYEITSVKEHTMDTYLAILGIIITIVVSIVVGISPTLAKVILKKRSDIKSNSSTKEFDGFVITTNSFTNTSVPEYYVPRKEYYRLIKLVKVGTKILLYGMCGNGKTELCKKLYNVYLNCYQENLQVPFDHIGFMKYEGSLDDTVVNSLGLRSGNHTRDIEAAWQTLKRIADNRRLLLIVDNIGSVDDDNSIA